MSRFVAFVTAKLHTQAKNMKLAQALNEYRIGKSRGIYFDYTLSRTEGHNRGILALEVLPDRVSVFLLKCLHSLVSVITLTKTRQKF